MVQSKIRYRQRFWRKNKKIAFFKFSWNAFFRPKFFPQNNGKWLILVLVVGYGPCKQSKPKNASKKLKRRREIFLLKMIKNLPKTNKNTKKCRFSHNFKCKQTILLDSSGRSRENLSCNVLLVDVYLQWLMCYRFIKTYAWINSQHILRNVWNFLHWNYDRQRHR